MLCRSMIDAPFNFHSSLYGNQAFHRIHSYSNFYTIKYIKGSSGKCLLGGVFREVYSGGGGGRKGGGGVVFILVKYCTDISAFDHAIALFFILT